MPGGYLRDPASGLPAVQTASGALLPLPLSADDMSLAGAQLAGPPGLPPAPDMGPDLRVAGPGGGPSGGGLFGVPGLSAGTLPVEPIRQAIGWRDPAEQGALPGSPLAAKLASQPPRQDAPVPRAGVDPATLARPRLAAPPASPAPQDAPSGLEDPLVRQAMAEAMRGGGGGPRRLGVTSETHKLTRPEAPIDPALASRANEAQMAADKYGEMQAMALTERREQAYQAQQAELAARSGQLQAQQERHEAQQALLRDYQAKRDAVASEAAQMKVPQMEDYWASRGTMAKMATALSITLGGALQGLRGGQNPGLEMSNQEIERWISSQREAYERARGKVADADNQYAKMVQAFGSENLALEHLREQAWTVRDGMLRAYAEKIGTPSALENYNQAMLQGEAERAALQARASQGAMVEIEQKLNMQGGGGGSPGVLKMLRAGAEARKLRDVIAGGDEKPAFQREVQNEKVEGITGALEAIEAADEVESALTRLGVDSDVDDPLSGAWDSTAGNIPGTQQRAIKQRLEQQTALLARGIQKSLGKSDNDAKLADQMATGGGSVAQRRMAAQAARQRSTGSLQNIVSSLTPAQQQALIRSLRANSPERAAQVEAAIGAVATPQMAPSEQVVR